MTKATATELQELSYSDALAELESIVEELDESGVDIDQLAIRFQRAIDLVEELDRRIVAAKKKVDELAPRLDALAES
jgi:exodeoxyribonuclease VII small subunit